MFDRREGLCVVGRIRGQPGQSESTRQMWVIGRKRFRVKVEWKGDFGKLMVQNVTTVRASRQNG